MSLGQREGKKRDEITEIKKRYEKEINPIKERLLGLNITVTKTKLNDKIQYD